MMPELLHNLRDLSFPYFRSEEKFKAFTLLAAIIVLNLGMVYIQVLVNQWMREFYDVLQTLDKKAFLGEIVQFCLLAGAYIAQAVYMVYLSQMLQIRWRKWLTDRYLGSWFTRQAYYRINFTASMTDNPDQRISEDINSYTELTIDLGTNLLNSAATLLSFLGILWLLSGKLTINLGYKTVINIPGYMVWAALFYSLLGTWLTMKIGNPLVLLNFNQQRFEADFRFGMVRVRENSEAIALYGGEKQEDAHLRNHFNILMDNFWKIMRRRKRLSWLTNSYSQAAVIFPVLMAAPQFFAGEMHLGGLMQTVGAFAAVHGALSYLVTSYTTIARWHAVIDRLGGFTRTMEMLRHVDESQQGAKRIKSSGRAMKADSLMVSLPNGMVLVRDLDLNIAPGAHLLITGPSGCGKSTLMRSLAGIWPFCHGAIYLPESASIMFMPQKPYLPLGTLRTALCYPHPNGYKPEDLENVLEKCGLGRLAASLEKNENWSQALSLGEQQRIAFARVLLARPDFIFLDEATASVDEKTEAGLYDLLQRELPDSAVTSIGHRGTLVAWHSEKLTFEGDAVWVKSELGRRRN
jgi:putative ATP-binding cassette transporter